MQWVFKSFDYSSAVIFSNLSDFCSRSAPLASSVVFVFCRPLISRSRDANVIQAGAVVGGSALSRVLGQALKEGDGPGKPRAGIPRWLTTRRGIGTGCFGMRYRQSRG